MAQCMLLLLLRRQYRSVPTFEWDLPSRQWLAVTSILLIAGAAGVAVPLALKVSSGAPLEERMQVATQLLDTVPLIDGHNDLPWNIRKFLHNQLNDFRWWPSEYTVYNAFSSTRSKTLWYDSINADAPKYDVRSTVDFTVHGKSDCSRKMKPVSVTVFGLDDLHCQKMGDENRVPGDMIRSRRALHFIVGLNRSSSRCVPID
uniref:Dipeptidase n=1 Tax=Anopheles coluzzii TaxID=1518534 RepID=A0A8W7PGR8_ANOCL